MKSTDKKIFFTKSLLLWNKKVNKRSMPWKGEKDPYKIWLSEIILQQTRVEQGTDYYYRFLKTFPTIRKLAEAREERVFKLWEGLGYYSRCKNLIKTARFIVEERKEIFPDSYDEILALKGVGPYTAAAIASFAFKLPHAVVDGNVFRILSRFFGIEETIDSTSGKKKFINIAGELLDHKEPGVYNQAIMDFGATVCKPQLPLCITCPLKIECVANAKGLIEKLPVKSTSPAKKKRWFYYFIIQHNNKIFVRKRGAGDIWENLYEFVLLESPGAITINEIEKKPLFKKISGRNNVIKTTVSELYRQQLSHQSIQGIFIYIKVKKAPLLENFEQKPVNKLIKLPFPGLITKYLAETTSGGFER